MKSIRFFLSNMAFAILLGSCITSCEDDLCSKDLLVFIRNWSGDSFKIQRTYTTDGTPSVSGTKDLKFPIYLTREASVDVQATVQIDESLVASYNEKNGSHYAMFPIEALVLTENVIIPAGSLQSPDSIEITIDYTKLNPGEYVLPLTVNSVQSADKGIRASVTAGTVYYKFTVSLDNINNSNTEVKGEKIDRSGWIITTNDEPDANFPITHLLDGDLDSAWKGTKRVKSEIIVDMGQEQMLKGFSFYHNGTHYDAPVSFLIYVSQDGETWFPHGEAGRYTFSSSIKEKEYGINFFVPVSCRYFKLKVNSVFYSTYAARFSELDALK